jgi:hypothetical protein
MADPSAPDPVAAELAGIGIRSEYASSRYADVAEVRESASDVPRLLAAVEAALRLADQWHDGRGNDYSASALYASKLREVLREELLSERQGDG